MKVLSETLFIELLNVKRGKNLKIIILIELLLFFYFLSNSSFNFILFFNCSVLLLSLFFNFVCSVQWLNSVPKLVVSWLYSNKKNIEGNLHLAIDPKNVRQYLKTKLSFLFFSGCVFYVDYMTSKNKQTKKPHWVHHLPFGLLLMRGPHWDSLQILS